MKQLAFSCLSLILCSNVAMAQSPDFFEVEPNETCAIGTPFTASSGVGGGQLSGNDDIDYFQFESSQTSALTLMLWPENSTYDGGVIRAAIYNQAGYLLASRRIRSDSNQEPLRAITYDNTLCIRFDKVPDYQIFTKEYRLQASVDQSQSAIDAVEDEPNDSMAQSNALSNDGSLVWAQLSSDEDVDIFEVGATAGYDVRVDIDVETRTYDGSTLKAWLVDSQGTPLAGREINSDQPDVRSLYARLPAGGPVYVKLEKRDHYTRMDRYVSISATGYPATGLRETEPNDAPGLNRIDGPGLLAGQLHSRDDIDVFDIALIPGIAQFQIQPENQIYDGGVVIFEISNSEGTLLASREIGSDSAVQTVNI